MRPTEPAVGLRERIRERTERAAGKQVGEMSELKSCPIESYLTITSDMADACAACPHRRASPADEIAAALRTTGTSAEKLTERIITAIMRGENAGEIETLLAFVDKLVEAK